MCGDGIVGAGESCEVCGPAGALTTIYHGWCASGDLANGRTPTAGAGGGDNCSERCTVVGLTGNPNAIQAVCGNNKIETGEECDTGMDGIGDDADGCTDSCVLTGSVYDWLGNPRWGPLQIAETRGTSGATNIQATTRGKTGSGVFIVQGPGGPGRWGPFTIQDYQPSGSQPACRNEMIYVRFSNPPDIDSVRTHVRIDNLTDGGLYGWDNKTTQVLNAPPGSAAVTITPSGSPARWEEGHQYRVTFPAGVIVDLQGQGLRCDNPRTPCTWTFRVGSEVCKTAAVDVVPLEQNVQPDSDSTPYHASIRGPAFTAQVSGGVQTVSGLPPQLRGTLSCDEDTYVCVSSTDGNRFAISANTDSGCAADTAFELQGLQPVAQLDRAHNVVSLGCGLLFEFPAPPAAGQWVMVFEKSWRSMLVAEANFRWHYAHIVGEEAVQDDAGKSNASYPTCVLQNGADNLAACTLSGAGLHADDYVVHSVTRWSPYIGAHEADITATYEPDNAEGLAKFWVGNRCTELYRSTNLYGVYPLTPEPGATRAIGHYDDKLTLLLSPSGTLEPKDAVNITYADGVDDGGGVKKLGKGVVMNNAASKLVYPAKGIIDPNRGSISLWVNSLWDGAAERMLAHVLGAAGNGSMELSFISVAGGGAVVLEYQEVSVQYNLPSAFFPGAQDWHLITASWEVSGTNVSVQLTVDDASAVTNTAVLGTGPLVVDDATELTIGTGTAGPPALAEARAVIDELEIRSDLMPSDEVAARWTAYDAQCISGAGAGGAPKVLHCTPSDSDQECKSPTQTVKCSSPLISVTFDQPMDRGTVLHRDGTGKYDNVLLCTRAGCQANENIITELIYDPFGRRVEVLQPTELTSGVRYHVVLQAGMTGLLSESGMALDGTAVSQWDFAIEAGARQCQCDVARVTVNPPNQPRTEDQFTCAGNVCVGDVDATAAGNQHGYTADCYDARADQPAAAVDYFWRKVFDVSGIMNLSCPPSPPAPAGCAAPEFKSKTIAVTNTLVNGYGRVAVTARGTGSTAGTAEQSVDVQNDVCADPWPSAWRGKWRDTGELAAGGYPVECSDGIDNDGNGSCDFAGCSGPPALPADPGCTGADDETEGGATPGARSNKLPYTNFELSYCRDVNATPQTIDDLPEADILPLVRVGGSLPKSFIFPLNYFGETPAIAIKEGYSFFGQLGILTPVAAVTGNNADDICARITTNTSASYLEYEFTIPKAGHYQAAFEVFAYDADFEQPTQFGIQITDESMAQHPLEQVTRLPSLLDRQIVTFDFGQRREGTARIALRYMNTDATHSGGDIFAVCRVGIGLANPVHDAIGIQVLSNPWRLSPATWYASGTCSKAAVPPADPGRLDGICFSDADCPNDRCVFNVPNRGAAAQSTTVDGYPAVRDGRTIYVGATNLVHLPVGNSNGHCSEDSTKACTVGGGGVCPINQACVGDTLYANIYLISYNDQANEQSEAVYDALLADWKFNVDLASFGACETMRCSAAGGDCTSLRCSDGDVGFCNLGSAPGAPCNPDGDVDNGFCFPPGVDAACGTGGTCQNVACSSDLDCPGKAAFSCLSPQSKIRRDTIRFGQLQDLQLSLRVAQRKSGGTFPLWDLLRHEYVGGTYVPGHSFSVWPSWKQSFKAQLGVTPPVDPLNVFVGCTTPYDPTTCWNEQKLQFGCPQQAFVYGYTVDSASDGRGYKLYTRMEFPTSQGGWRGPASDVSGLGDACFNFLALGSGDADRDGVRDDIDDCVGTYNPYVCIGGGTPGALCPKGPGGGECGAGICGLPDSDAVDSNVARRKAGSSSPTQSNAASPLNGHWTDASQFWSPVLPGQTGYTASAWYQVDLGRIVQFNHVKLFPDPADPGSFFPAFNILVSNDPNFGVGRYETVRSVAAWPVGAGGPFETVTEIVENFTDHLGADCEIAAPCDLPGVDYVINLGATTNFKFGARYVRILRTSAAPVGNEKLAELEVWSPTDGLGDACDPCPHSPDNDRDHDGVCEAPEDNPQYGYRADNCPDVPNPDQRDSDVPPDGVGDACDMACASDQDRDGICDENDNCPTAYNPDQDNSDGDAPTAVFPAGITRSFCVAEANCAGVACFTDPRELRKDCTLTLDCLALDSTGAPMGRQTDLCQAQTPDVRDGQVWPNGHQWGDACDLCSDVDYDGWGAGTPAENCRKDNCTYTNPDTMQGYNPGQEDFDNDGVGYLCDTCIDTDNDRTTDQTVGNSSFEDGLNGFTFFASPGVDAHLRQATDYLRLYDFFPSRSHGRTYRGVHSAEILLMSLNQGQYVALRTKDNPAHVNISPDYGVRYTIQARVRPSDPQMVPRLRLRPIRACTHFNDGRATANGVSYRTDCRDVDNEPSPPNPVAVNRQGFRLPLRMPMAMQDLGGGWYTLRSEFIADATVANDPIAFELALEVENGGPGFGNNASLNVDDFNVSYQCAYCSESCRREGWAPLGNDNSKGEELWRITDNCRTLNNPTRCVGGRYNNQICNTSLDCIRPVLSTVKAVTVYEQSGKVQTKTFDASSGLATDPLVNAINVHDAALNIGGLHPGNCDLWTDDGECYDFYWSDRVGAAPVPGGTYLAMQIYRDPLRCTDATSACTAVGTPLGGNCGTGTCVAVDGKGGNIDAVKLDLVSGAAGYAVGKTNIITEAGVVDDGSGAVGSPDTRATALGNGATRLVLDFKLQQTGRLYGSCKEILEAGEAWDGIAPDGSTTYPIDTNGDGTKDEDVFCDMTTDGGGWTLVARMNDADAKHWVTQFNKDMGTTWWFDGPGAGHGAWNALGADYKAKAFDTIPLSDIMVTVQKNANPVFPNAANETYAVWRNNVGDGQNTFANQLVWKTAYCPSYDPTSTAINSGHRGAVLSPPHEPIQCGSRPALAASSDISPAGDLIFILERFRQDTVDFNGKVPGNNFVVQSGGGGFSAAGSHKNVQSILLRNWHNLPAGQAAMVKTRIRFPAGVQLLGWAYDTAVDKTTMAKLDSEFSVTGGSLAITGVDRVLEEAPASVTFPADGSSWNQSDKVWINAGVREAFFESFSNTDADDARIFFKYDPTAVAGPLFATIDLFAEAGGANPYLRDVLLCDGNIHPPGILGSYTIQISQVTDPVHGIVLGPSDGSAGTATTCAKKKTMQGITDDLSAMVEGGIEAAEFSIIAIASGDDSFNPSPQGLGNWTDGGPLDGNDPQGEWYDFQGWSEFGLLNAANNYGQVWFRERAVYTGAPGTADSAGTRNGIGVCMQPDYDEDNVGDACDRCTDRDSDRFGDTGFTISGCSGSFNKSDTCPATYNPEQTDYDQDVGICRFDTLQPYTTIGSPPECNSALGFPLGSTCQFCGGDACDLDADGDVCYNWEQLKRQVGQEGNPQLAFARALESLPAPNFRLFREEGYAQSLTHDETSWRSRGRDVDADGISDDCDAQACGNGEVENVKKIPKDSDPGGGSGPAYVFGQFQVWWGCTYFPLDPVSPQAGYVNTHACFPYTYYNFTARRFTAATSVGVGNYQIYVNVKNSPTGPHPNYEVANTRNKGTAWQPGSFELTDAAKNAGWELVNRLPYAGGSEKFDLVWPATWELDFPSTWNAARNQCFEAVSGVQMCEECDMDNFLVGQFCDKHYAVGSGTYREIYPLPRKGATTLFLAHYDDSVEAISGTNQKFNIQAQKNLAFSDGLTDGSTNLATGAKIMLGKSLQFKADSVLQYDTAAGAGDVYGPGDRTASIWINVNDNVDKLRLASISAATVDLGTTWQRNTWHNVTVTWNARDAGGGKYDFLGMVLYLDGVRRDVSLLGPAVDPPPNLDISWWLWVLGLNGKTVALDEVEFQSVQLSQDEINARVTAIRNKCLGTAIAGPEDYMVENLCAFCNNLRCQIRSLRTCLKDLDISTISVPPNPPTEYIWIARTTADIVTQMVAIGPQAGTIVHEYKVCPGPCAMDYGPKCPDGNLVAEGVCNTTCAADCGGGGAIAKYPTRTAVNVEAAQAWVSYRHSDYVALFDSKTGLVKACGNVQTSNAGKGVAIDSEGFAWAGASGRDPAYGNNFTIKRINPDPAAGCAPVRVISGGPQVYGLTMDSKDNLWQSSMTGNNTWYEVVRYTNVLDPTLPVVNAASDPCDTAFCKTIPDTPAYGVGMDMEDNPWFGHTGGMAKIDRDPPYTVTKYDLGTWGRGIGLDDQGRVWTANNQTNTLTGMYPDGTGKIILTMPAGAEPTGVSGDSDGMVWGTGYNGWVARFNPNSGAMLFSKKFPGDLVYMYSDFLGANRAFVLRTVNVVYPPAAAENFQSFDTPITSWNGRWGKILYDFEDLGVNRKIQLFVYVSDDPAGFPPGDADTWIPADNRYAIGDKVVQTADDNFNARIGTSPLITASEFKARKGEVRGKYLKFMAAVQADRFGGVPKITNLRITCKDDKGRYLCGGL
ncbi:MAG: Ig-like domain-containing protein [Patescibacteria group bacterium]|nr:Ig-like domain-containing protein [Patescibacteria group bacterium]